MRLLQGLWLALAVLAASPAEAVIRGAVARDPNGIRQYVVRVESSQGELCSGVLIAQDLVLTAAHCVIERAAYRVIAVDRTFSPRTVRVLGVAAHPAFVPGTTPRTQPGVDLAILKLERSLGSDFTPLDHRTGRRVSTGESLVLAGFGVVSEARKNTARTLRQADVVALGPMQVMNRVLVVVDAERMAESAGAGACRGDSGGPILGRSGQLLGIVSWSSGALGERRATACGGFTAVTPLAEHGRWISDSVQSLSRTPTARLRGVEGDWMRRR
jgi:secreted trypsin-like serine protease